MFPNALARLPSRLLCLSLLLRMSTALAEEDIDGEMDKLVKMRYEQDCVAEGQGPECPRLAEFLKAGRPDLPPGELLTFGRSVGFRRDEQLKGYMSLHSVREGEEVKLIALPIKPSTPGEEQDSDLYAQKREAGQVDATSGTHAFLLQAAPRQKHFPAERRTRSLVYRDPSTGMADGTVVVRQKGSWLYVFRLTGSLRNPVSLFAWLAVPPAAKAAPAPTKR